MIKGNEEGKGKKSKQGSNPGRCPDCQADALTATPHGHRDYVKSILRICILSNRTDALWVHDLIDIFGLTPVCRPKI